MYKNISLRTCVADAKIFPIPIMVYQSIKQWPENERPRERLLEYGAESLSDAQLLAIVLRTGGGQKSALDLALEILNVFGGLKRLEVATMNELSGIKGLGKAKIAQVKAACELGRRLSREAIDKGPAFSTSQEAYQYYHNRFDNCRKEEFHCAILDAKNRMMRNYRVSVGTLTQSLIHPREAFREAIRESAASVIFIHNHPSGDPTPSRDDILVTEKLVNAGDLIGIKVLDHIIIGNRSYVSMMEHGYIK